MRNTKFKSFDENLECICQTCHKQLHENEILCQAACNEMALDPIPIELKDLKEIKKVLISKIVLFEKMAIIQGKGEFF